MKRQILFTKIVFSIFTVLTLLFFYFGSDLIANNSNLGSKIISRKENNIQRTYKYALGSKNNLPKVLGVSTSSDKALSIPVLYYHGITEKESPGTTSWENFKNQMLDLKSRGFNTITLLELEDFLKNNKQLPNKSFLLTFDDGRKDSYYPVDPILKQFNYSAVMFVITSEINKNNSFHLNKEEIIEMSKSGRWELQSHSNDLHHFISIDSNGNKGHAMSNKMWLTNADRLETDEEYENRIHSDLNTSKKVLERLTNKKVVAFAIPYGDFGQEITNYPQSKEVLTKLFKDQFQQTFYQTYDINNFRNYPNVDVQFVKRIGNEDFEKSEYLVNHIEMTQEKVINYTDNFGKDNGWKGLWGKYKIENNQLEISADTNTTGGMAFLEGTQLWEDFIATASVQIHDGQNFSILFAKTNKGSYSCKYANGRISFVKNTGSLENEMLTWNNPKINIMEKVNNVGVKINKNKVSCLYENNEIITKNLPSTHIQGSIGFSVWSGKNNLGKIIIDNLYVEKTI